MAKKAEVRKFGCGECKRITYWRREPGRKGAEREKLQTNKYCKFCRKHTEHKERKK